MPSTDLDEAIARHQAGDLGSARTIYEALLAEDDSQADVLNLLGVLKAQEGDVEAAETMLLKAVEVDPKHARAHGSLGNLRRMQDRMEDAVAAYHRARELDPDNPVVQFNLASAYGATDKPEEAEAGYRRAIELQPDNADAHLNLGVLLSTQDRLVEAIELVTEGLRHAPENAGMHEKLGDLYRRHGRFDKAADAFEAALEKDPERQYLDHLVHAYRGDKVDTASTDYVRYLFDSFAEDYEDRLVGVLGYRAPELLRELLDTHVGSDVRFNHGLDLGCGTGLSGKAFSDVVARLDGVDLSGEMLDRARERDVYQELAERGIEDYLEACDHQFDLFLACDVFVYVGDLKRTFELMRERAEDGAIALFTTEREDADDFVLRRTGRYGHSAHYLDRLARECGFQLLHRSDETLRSENGEPVTGYRCLMVAV